MSRLTVCAPLGVEARALRRGLAASHDRAEVIRTGYGPVRAAAAASRIAASAPDMLAVGGVGGALTSDLNVGDLVVASEVTDGVTTVTCASAPLLAGELRRAGLEARTGPIATTRHLVRAGEHAELAATGAVAVDMESVPLLAGAAESGVIKDAAVAVTESQRADFWRLRDNLSDAQRFEGGSIKHDVSVAVTDVPAFLEEVEAAIAAAAPGARLVAFGHLGDGNIHCNVSQPIGADKAAFLKRWGEINAIVHGIVARHNGSISAEHGVGQLKRDLLPQVKDPVAMELMRALKRTLDPQGILNPSKVL